MSQSLHKIIMSVSLLEHSYIVIIRSAYALRRIVNDMSIAHFLQCSHHRDILNCFEELGCISTV